MSEPTPSIPVGDFLCDIYEVSVTDGVIDQRHLGLYEERWDRAKNWLAIVYPNRIRPGGLDRTFLGRALGSKYLTKEVKAGDFIEVGADRVSTHNKIPARAYFRVLIVKANTWIIRESEVPEDSLTIPSLAVELELLRQALTIAPEPVEQPHE